MYLRTRLITSFINLEKFIFRKKILALTKILKIKWANDIGKYCPIFQNSQPNGQIHAQVFIGAVHALIKIKIYLNINF